MWVWGVVVALVGVGAVTMGTVVRDRQTGQPGGGSGAVVPGGGTPVRIPGAPDPIEPAVRDSEVQCERVEFPAELPVSEASGAAYLAAGSGSADTSDAGTVLVVGDSGNGGRYIEIDGSTGQLVRRGRFAMDRRASDDLEGLAVRGQVVYGITSSGWVRHWKRGEKDYELIEPAYPIAPEGSPQVCGSAFASNCGPNYEGLCLREPGGESEAGSEAGSDADRCIGFAVAKAHGTLYCVVSEGGKLRVDPAHALRILPPGVATGCDFDAEGVLWLGTNLFGGNRILRLRDWDDLERVTTETVDVRGSGFAEALAIGRDGAVYSFSDMASRTSGASKFICRPRSTSPGGPGADPDAG